MTDRTKALLFDLGGVVMDIDFGRIFERWAAHAGCDPATLAARWSPDEAYARHERSEIDAAEYFAHLRKVLGIDISDAQFMDGWNALFIGQFPGVEELLATARTKLPLYAFSNSNPTHVAHWSHVYADALSYFDEIFISSDIGLRKPDRAAFDHVVKQIDVPAGNILFFDDLAENVEGARRAGLQAVQVVSLTTLSVTLASLEI